MSESKHTPGPWRVEKTGKPSKRVFAGDELIATIRHFFTGVDDVGPLPSQTRANARLIAAAPDLLEACEAFAAFERHTPDCANCDEWGAGNCEEGHRLYSVACDSINEAIAKAKGES